jgi:hypothetical protein
LSFFRFIAEIFGQSRALFGGLQGLLAIQAYCVGHCGEDGHGGHGYNGDCAADIEKAMRPSWDVGGGEEE